VRGYGIDFGTTNSIVAYYDHMNEKAVPLLSIEDGRPHPSVVWYRVGGKSVVGREAKRNINGLASVAGNAFVTSIKRRLGQDFVVDILGQPLQAWEVARDIFRHLVDQAQRPPHCQDLRDVVVTVPVRFDGRARRDLRRAADQAGLYIKTFVHEPFAAVVGYVCQEQGIKQLSQMEGRTILVFDWGGGTLDITAAKITSDGLVELATQGLADRAGDYIDGRLLKYAQRVFLTEHRLASQDVIMLPGTKDRFLFECEQCKIALSRRAEAAIEVSQAFRVGQDARDLSIPLMRRQLEGEIQEAVTEALSLVHDTLDAAHLSPRQVDDVLLIGGTSLIPMIRDQLHELFGFRLVDVPNADTLIAEGAALVDALGMQPFLARSLVVLLSDDTYFSLFQQGTIASPRTCREALQMFCTDGRDGWARLIVQESAAYGNIHQFQTKTVLPIPVSSNLNGNYHLERVAVDFMLDEDLVLHISGKGATREEGTSVEIVDLCFGLTTQGR
jgi:molecular chaperone DnaK